VVLSPGANLTYATVAVIPLPSALVVEGAPLESGDELVVLNATVPNGLSLRFEGSNLVNTIYEEVPVVSRVTVTINLAAAQNVSPGVYTIGIKGTSGTYSSNFSLQVNVVQFLVTARSNAFAPSSLSVKAGSTVYWVNLGTGGSGGDMTYDVEFNTINVQSPPLQGPPFDDSFSYTFTTPGSYSYTCGFVGAGMSGTVTVTN